jgi:uncharacterized protein YecE (DUF72 family)
MGWSYKFWVGKLYPNGTKPSKYLNEYSSKFNSVEIDATFYRIPSSATVGNWRDSVPKGFKFSAKFPQKITHAPDLDFDTSDLEVFLRRINGLGDRLGPLLLQFPPYLKADKHQLDHLIAALPENHLIAAEFRNRSWFAEEFYKILHDNDVSLAITNRPTSTKEVTGEFIYLRLEGDRKLINGEKGEVEIDRSSDTKYWARWIREKLDSGIKVFCYISKYYSGYPPYDLETMKSYINEKS